MWVISFRAEQVVPHLEQALELMGWSVSPLEGPGHT